MNTIKRCLIASGSYRYGSTTLKNGRISPYIVSSINISNEVEVISLKERILSILPWKMWHNPLIIGISNSGIQLSKVVYDSVKKYKENTYTIHLDPKNIFIPKVDTRHITPIIVDNAITTGKTVSLIHGALINVGIYPFDAVYYFDREEVEPDGRTVAEKLKASIGIKLHPLFRVRDLLSCIPLSEQQFINKYLMKHGSRSIKNFLEDKHVF